MLMSWVCDPPDAEEPVFPEVNFLRTCKYDNQCFAAIIHAVIKHHWSERT